MIDLEELRKAERALIIGIQEPADSLEQAQYHLAELSGLALAMGLDPVEEALVRVVDILPRYYIGPGKAQEISLQAQELEAELIVVDCELSPSQLRNWERLVKIPVLDRQQVILEIFGQRARTKEARLQVELAQLEYHLPRLTRAWTHLSRQRGGARGTRGEGETQLETDRRLIQKRISRIKKDLKTVISQRAVLRKGRQTIPLPGVALVGYTNAGKSSLLTALTRANVLVEDKLFATLDPTTRRWELGRGQSILLTDTVGFIRKLPHGLVKAFRATLEETLRADVLFHLVDAANPEFPEHIRTTRKVLEEIGAGEIPSVLLFNKIDLLDQEEISSLRRLYPDSVFVSASSLLGMDELAERTRAFLQNQLVHVEMRLPHAREDLAALFHRNGAVEQKVYDEEGIHIVGRIPQRIMARLAPFVLSHEASKVHAGELDSWG